MNEHGCYFLTLETIDLVDIFTRPVYKQIIVHTLNHFIDNKGFIVYGWCLMSNRLYLVCQAEKDILLGDIRKGFKQFTTEKIVETVHTEPDERKSWILGRFEKHTGLFGSHKTLQCWKPIKNPVQLDVRKPEAMAEQIEMIHNVPVKERIVQYPQDYLYSSAKDYEESPGLVKIVKLSAVSREIDDIQNMKSGFTKRYKSN